MEGAQELDPQLAGRFARALLELEAELDWELLGRLHCWEGGEDFFSPAQREALRDCGLAFAEEVASALGGPLAPGPRRSLYVGASVAELAPMLCESLVLGREVLLLQLAGPEAAELARALEAVRERTGAVLPRLSTAGFDELPRAFASHGWLVSVLTDPERFPALHDALYERRGELATGRGELGQERREARALLERFLDRLAPPCLLSTTDEELGLVEAACRLRGWRLAVPAHARLSCVVGDPVRHCRVELRGEPVRTAGSAGPRTFA